MDKFDSTGIYTDNGDDITTEYSTTCIKFTVQYDGRNFAGWQVQPGLRTVQGCIQQTLSKLFKFPVVIHGSGRTDAGVHSLGQVFHCSGRIPIPIERMIKPINSRLPEDISIIEVERVDENFHARYCVKSKTYRYRVLNTEVRDPLLSGYTWNVRKKIDLIAVKEALKYIKGTHDFKGFSATGSPKKTTVRTLHHVDLYEKGDEIWFEFSANGFLYHMVRNMVGTLYEIGIGRMKPLKMKEILESKDRSRAGKTAPAQGLYLVRVEY